MAPIRNHARTKSRSVPPCTMCLSGFLGILVIRVACHGSRASAVKGSISPTKSTASISSGTIAIGRPYSPVQRRLISTTNSSQPLEVKLLKIVFFKFSKITLHSLMACTKSPKLSLSKISEAASLATSDHVSHIATPTSALLSAGASLIPSPVTATIALCSFRTDTILNLSSGEVLENIT